MTRSWFTNLPRLKRSGRTLPCTEKGESFTGTRGAIDFKPRGHHIVFTHFPKDPNCEECRMTKNHSRLMRKHISETRRWATTTNLTQRTDDSGPRYFELGICVKKWSLERSRQNDRGSARRTRCYSRIGFKVIFLRVPIRRNRRHVYSGFVLPSQKIWEHLHGRQDLKWNATGDGNGSGTAEWMLVTTCGMCTIRWPMARKHMSKYLV